MAPCELAEAELTTGQRRVLEHLARSDLASAYYLTGGIDVYFLLRHGAPNQLAR